MLWSMIGGSVVYEAFQLYAGIDSSRIFAGALVFLSSVFARDLLRREHLRAAGWIAMYTLFGVACTSIWLGGGVDAPGTVTLVLLIVISATALEWLPTILFALLSLAAVSGFAIAETQGWMPPVGPRRSPVELWFIYSLHIVVAAWLVSYYAGTFRGVLGTLGSRSVALADSEERYARLVERSPDVIVALDADGVVVECSPAIETLYGYSPSEVVGHSFLELGVIPPQSLAETRDLFSSHFAGEELGLVETQVIHRDGSLRWAEANSQIVWGEDGRAQLYLVIRDITGRVEAEQRRTALEDQLVEARRLEALGRMAGGLAHDFNNLLLVILSNIELLEEDSELPAESLLKEIRVAGESAADLTGQLLAFAGRQVQEADGVDVGSTLRKIDGLLRRLLQPHVTLEIRTEEDLPPARGGAAQLEQVLVNLVMNAQQAITDDGTIMLESSGVEVTEAECEEYPAASPGGHIRIAVTDSGRGMDDEAVHHIFEPFYSDRAGGTGLGLATVHGVVNQNDGHIRVHSKLGEGTTFEVLLPEAPRVASLRRESSSVPSKWAPSQEAVVLLVDDEPRVLNSVSRLLERQGFRVLRADSLETARAASEREPGRIDVLLTDVLMPGTNGPKLAEELIATRREMKVLLMSGYTHDHFANDELLRTSAFFISKPFSGAAMANKIRSILRDSKTTPPSAPAQSTSIR